MATIDVSGLCRYRIDRVIDELGAPDEPGGLNTPEDVIMWALDAAIESGWMDSDAHLLGTNEMFEDYDGPDDGPRNNP